MRENLIGGNRSNAGDTDAYLLETLRTCRLAVLIGLGRTVALYHRSSAPYQIHEHNYSVPLFLNR